MEQLQGHHTGCCDPTCGSCIKELQEENERRKKMNQNYRDKIKELEQKLIHNEINVEQLKEGNKEFIDHLQEEIKKLKEMNKKKHKYHMDKCQEVKQLKLEKIKSICIKY